MYDLGLVEVSDTMELETLTTQPTAHPPPCCTQQEPPPQTLVKARHIPLPPRLTEQPDSTSARAAKLTKEQRWARVQDPYRNTVLEHVNRDGLAVANYKITRQDTAQVYFSPHAYHQAFKELINLRRYTLYGKLSGGMRFDDVNGRLILADIVPSPPVARIPSWRTRLRGA